MYLIAGKTPPFGTASIKCVIENIVHLFKFKSGGAGDLALDSHCMAANSLHYSMTIGKSKRLFGAGNFAWI